MLRNRIFTMSSRLGRGGPASRHLSAAVTPVHDAAREGFRIDTIERYEAGRPSYDVGMLREVLEAQGITNDDDVVIADIGSGTGKLLAALDLAVQTLPSLRSGGQPRGVTNAQLVAVEPSGLAMNIAPLVPGATIVRCAAEELGEELSSVDSMWVGQAFHWFATAAAVRRMHGALLPDACLNLVWNTRDVSEPSGFMAALEELVDPYYTPDVPRQQTGEWKQAFQLPETEGLFGEMQHQQVKSIQSISDEAFPERILSLSVVARLPAEEQAELRDRVVQLVAAFDPRRDERTGDLLLPHVTDLYSLKRIGA